MKKIFLLISFLAAFFVSNAQYPVVQFLGRDSALVDSRGGLKARLINYAFTDTTQANTQRISQYPGALIYTTSGGDKLWLRSADATLWTRVGTTGGGGSGIVSLGTSAYGLTIQNDSTYKADTNQLSTRLWRQKGIDSVQGNVNLKLNITDTANMRARLYAGSNVTITGTYPNLTIASTGGGSSDSSIFLVDTTYTRLAKAFGTDTLLLKSLRMQLNGVDITPTATDSTLSWNILASGSGTNNANAGSGFRLLKPTSQEIKTIFAGLYTTIDSSSNTDGLTIKADTATMFPAIRATIPGASGLTGSGTDLQLALWNGTSSLTGHQRYTWANSNDYPSLTIGAGSGTTYGSSLQLRSVVGDYGSISTDGNQLALYGLSGTKSINLYSHSGGSILLGLSKGTTGGTATFSKTVISVDTAVGGPSNGSIHGEYAAGDSTTSGTDVGRHMFRGIGRTYANVGSFNTFYSTVSATNTGSGITQDHIVSWQSDAEKSGASTLNIIYESAMLATNVKAGTVGKKYGWKYWDANVYAGAVLGSQMAFKTDKLKAASGLNFHFLADSSHYGQLDGNMLLGDTVVAASARKTIHIFNGTAPSSNISGAVIYAESGELKARDASGNITILTDAIPGTGINNANIGSGFRWLNPGTQELRTLFAGLYMTADSSSNTNGLTVSADSSAMAGYFLRRKDSASASNPLGFVSWKMLRDTAAAISSRIGSGGGTPSLTSTYVGFGDGSNLLTGSSRMTFNNDANYPTLTIDGTYEGYLYLSTAVAADNFKISGAGGGTLYGSDTYKSVSINDHIYGGQVARFYDAGGIKYTDINGVTTFTSTANPTVSSGAVSVVRTVPYSITGNNFNGITDVTDFRIGAASNVSFAAFAQIGNNRTNQEAFTSFRSKPTKDSSNTVGKMYDFLADNWSMKAGTVDTAYRIKIRDINKTGGTLSVQYGIYVDSLSAASANYNFLGNRLGIGVKAPTEMLDVLGSGKFSGTLTTGDPGSGAGAWKLGTAVTTSGLALNTTTYVEITIGGTTYRLAVVDPPQP